MSQVQWFERDIDGVDVEFPAHDVAHPAFGAALVVDLDTGHAATLKSVTGRRAGGGAGASWPSTKAPSSPRSLRIVTPRYRARPAAEFSVDRLFDKFLDDAAAHRDVAAVFDRLARENLLQASVGDRVGQRIHPAVFDDLRSEIECRDADRVRISREVAQREYVIGERRIDAEAAVGMAEGVLLASGETVPEQRVEIQRLVRRFVDDLLREQVFDRGREVVISSPCPQPP